MDLLLSRKIGQAETYNNILKGFSRYHGIVICDGENIYNAIAAAGLQQYNRGHVINE